MLAWTGFNMLQCNNYTHEVTSYRVHASEDKSSECGAVFFHMILQLRPDGKTI